MAIFDGQADLLATLFASTATFQSITGTTTVAAAKARIGLHQSADEGVTNIAYPRITIFEGGTVESEKAGTGVWRGRGSLFALFEIEIPAASAVSVQTQRACITSKISAIIREAQVIADSRATPTGYTTSHLQVRRFVRTSGPDFVRQIDREQNAPGDAAPQPLWEMEWEIEY
jgi:hypothetical protein